MTENNLELTDTLRKQYDAPMYEALLLVFGDNIHHAVCESSADSFADGSQRANQLLAEASGLERGMQVLETACGVGGAARYLARDFNVEVVATNLSEGQLTIARQRTATDGLGHKVRFEYADFTELPYAEGEFDCYWCQDSWLYGEDKPRIIAEAFRVLAPGGRLVFSDIVVTSSADESPGRAFLDRIHAPAMWTATGYDTALPLAGFLGIKREDWSRHLRPSLEMICEAIASKKERMVEIAGIDEVEDTIQRFEAWRQAARSGHLGHVFFCARKPELG
jgi:sarcosine/dimethylglycine N-methyltransferase